MFIKLTDLKNTNSCARPIEFYIKVDLIEAFYRDNDCTRLDLLYGGYTVKESPEEILKLIKECEK